MNGHSFVWKITYNANLTNDNNSMDSDAFDIGLKNIFFSDNALI